VARTLGILTMVGVVVAGFFHYMKVGPLEVDERDDGSPTP
jgi:formate dehydrogenase iron-sulfur subunit